MENPEQFLEWSTLKTSSNHNIFLIHIVWYKYFENLKFEDLVNCDNEKLINWFFFSLCNLNIFYFLGFWSIGRWYFLLLVYVGGNMILGLYEQSCDV
jgi:hypothetical protein